MTALHSVSGNYGQDWVEGVLSDHLHLAESRGLITVFDADGGFFVRDVDTFDMLPVVCSEIVWIYTEDGRMDGRCGKPFHAEDGCAVHGNGYTI